MAIHPMVVVVHLTAVVVHLTVVAIWRTVVAIRRTVVAIRRTVLAIQLAIRRTVVAIRRTMVAIRRTVLAVHVMMVILQTSTTTALHVPMDMTQAPVVVEDLEADATIKLRLLLVLPPMLAKNISLLAGMTATLFRCSEYRKPQIS